MMKLAFISTTMFYLLFIYGAESWRGGYMFDLFIMYTQNITIEVLLMLRLPLHLVSLAFANFE